MNGKYSLSIILPVYNEEYNLERVIEGIVNFLQNQDIFEKYEIIVVDDGSGDNTHKILSELAYKIPYIKSITHCENLGYGEALMSGVKISRYSLFFFMDADRQFNIRDINRMFIYLDDFDIIAGYRYKREDAFHRIILGKAYSWIAFLLFGLRLKDINCGFKLFKKEILEDEGIQSRDGIFYTEIFVRAKTKGYRIKEVPVEHFPRLSGKATGASPKVIFNSIVDLIMLRYLLRRSRVGTFDNTGGGNEGRKIGINRL